ncbi:MAG: TonB-dependent receptor [Terriglobia bacterium]
MLLRHKTEFIPKGQNIVGGLSLSALLFYLVIIAAPALAQESRATIVGRVTDSSGAVVPGATVTATNQQTNVAVHTVSNAVGDYLIPALNPGTYNVSVALAGFKTSERDNIQLRILDRIRLDFTLEPGAVTQTIEVQGKTPLLETASTNVGQVISNTDILEIPMAHGSVRELFMLVAGMTVSAADSDQMMNLDPSRPAESSGMSFNGSPLGTTEMMLDGVPDTQAVNSDFGESEADQPPFDSLQEVKLETTYDASMGHTSGSDVNMVLKSGTNRLHGTGYFFYRNPALDSNSFFSNMAGLPKLHPIYQRGGFNIGGPIIIPKIYNGTNRTFFSYSYEAMNDDAATYPLVTTVPTQAERQGDFSALLTVGPQYQIYDPNTIAAAPGGLFSRKPLAGNIVPPSRISPIATNIESFWPMPNVPGTVDGEENYSVSNRQPNKYQNHLVRFDHAISDKQHLYGHVTRYFKKEGPYRNYFPVASGNVAKINPWNAALDDTFTFSPHWVLDLRYGLERFPLVENPVSTGFNMASLGFPQTLMNQIAYRDPTSVTFPRTDVSGLQTQQGETPWNEPDESQSWFADLYHPVGNHELKFGVDNRNYLQNAYSPTDGTPHFVFGTAYTNGPLNTSASSPDGVGQGMAALLLGEPSGGDIMISDSYADKSAEYGAYIQDNWRVVPKLTVTMGLRYEYYSPITERYNRSVRGFDPEATLPIGYQVEANYAANPISEIPAGQFPVTGGVLFAGVGGQPRTLYPADTHDFMPRVGFAYHPLKNTVMRAGYGIYVLDNGVISGFGPNQMGYSQTTNIIPTVNNGLSYIANLSNPFPNGIALPPGNTLGPMTNVGLSNSYFDEGIRTPYMQRWNWTMQQVLPGGISLQVGYAGSRSVHLRIPDSTDGLPDKYLSTLPVRDQATINTLSAAVPNPFYPLLPGTSLSSSTVGVSQLLQPFPQFTSLSTSSSQGYSTYNSLQALVERRMANGFSVSFTYTRSKEMDAITYNNVADPVPYRSISVNDRPNHIGLTLVYELPFGTGKALLANSPSPLRGVVGGWQASFLVNQWSGTPLSFGDMIFNGNIKNIPLPASQRTVQRWFNTSAGFVTDPSQQLADNLFRGPTYLSGVRCDGINTTDISLARRIPLRGDKKLEIRMEALNAFNHPNFGAPDTGVTDSTFGMVSSEISFTRIVQFGLIFTF